MGSLTDLNDLVNRATGGSTGNPEHLWFNKSSRMLGASVNLAGSIEYSCWMWEGHPGAPAATPGGTAVAPTNATDGALKQADPTGGRQKWLTQFANSHAFGISTYLLYDRLLHISGLSGTVTTAQTVGGALTRYTGTEAVGNQMWVEIYTAIGATARTLTANYTDENSVAQVSNAVTVGGTTFQDVARMARIPLASGAGFGVSAIADVTLSGSTLVAGDFGITIARPLAYLNILQAGGGAVPLTYLEQLADIKPGACLALALFAHQAMAPCPSLGGQLSMVEA